MSYSYSKYLVTVSAVALMSACSSGRSGKDEPSVPAVSIADQRQINMTILLDLSSRVKATYGQDNQLNRDVAVVQSTATWFKESIAKKGAYGAKGIYNIFFEPQPTLDANLNEVASSLSFDMSKPNMEPQAKKKIFDTIVPKSTQGVKRLYESVVKQPALGADIWSFAKDKMASRCILDTAKYRNILVLVTDGYIDYKTNREIKGNKSAFINAPYISNTLVGKGGFTAANWSEKYKAGQYGLIVPPGANLKGLEVLVVEINNYNGPIFHKDLLKQYVGDWFQGMGASRVAVLSSDLPKYTESEIGKFLNH